MNNTIVQNEGAAAHTVAGHQDASTRATIKLGLDIHAKLYVVAAQYDHALPKPPRRFAPAEFVPWVESLLRAGHRVHVVYEACGFGFGLYRQLLAAGAHCCVIAPRKLDEQRTGVKTDPRDALTLCQRLSRYVEGNTRELALIRVPTEEEERARHVSRQRERLVRHRQKLEAAGRGCSWATVCRPARTGGSPRRGAARASIGRRGSWPVWKSIARRCWPCTSRSARSRQSSQRPRPKSCPEGWVS